MYIAHQPHRFQVWSTLTRDGMHFFWGGEFDAGLRGETVPVMSVWFKVATATVDKQLSIKTMLTCSMSDREIKFSWVTTVCDSRHTHAFLKPTLTTTLPSSTPELPFSYDEVCRDLTVLTLC